MSPIPLITIKAKIKTRLMIIERNLEKSLSKEKISRIKEHIHKKFNLKPEETQTGVEEPKLFTKNILGFIDK
jgi:hypothetical protein